ncbi:MAG: hypothetical protein IJ475_00445 [Bacilli bacterium]|nr:hypothetical protein [Bacilli bacterium]
MKESIGNMWLIGLMVTFILIFVAYIIVTIDYNRTYKMKNEILTIIEKKHGITNYTGVPGTSSITGESVTVNSGTLQTINAFLYGSAYDMKGKCPKSETGKVTWYGVDNIENTNALVPTSQASLDKNYYYCFARYDIKGSKTYYRIRIFFRLDFPVIGDLLKFDVDGTTNVIPNLDPSAM